MKVRLFLSIFIFSVAQDAYGQICSMSHYPYGWLRKNRPLMHGSEFKSVSKYLPFIEAEDRKNRRYAEFWVTADVLNIRSGPSIQHKIVSETYFGNLVFALAKQGDWVAIGRGATIEGIEVMPRWVHIEHLSSTSVNEQVDTQLLKRKCEFLVQGAYLADVKDLSFRLSNAYNPCSAIRSYLTHQRLLGSTHAYEIEYKDWRQSQNNPDDYSRLGC